MNRITPLKTKPPDANILRVLQIMANAKEAFEQAKSVTKSATERPKFSVTGFLLNSAGKN